MGPRPLRYLAAVLALAAVYFVAAKLGLRMAPVAAQEVSPVWPPSGIALAAILLFGYRIWPGVAFGWVCCCWRRRSRTAGFGGTTGRAAGWPTRFGRAWRGAADVCWPY